MSCKKIVAQSNKMASNTNSLDYENFLRKMDYGKYDKWNDEFGYWSKVVPNLKDLCFKGNNS